MATAACTSALRGMQAVLSAGTENWNDPELNHQLVISLQGTKPGFIPTHSLLIAPASSTIIQTWHGVNLAGEGAMIDVIVMPQAKTPKNEATWGRPENSFEGGEGILFGGESVTPQASVTLAGSPQLKGPQVCFQFSKKPPEASRR